MSSISSLVSTVIAAGHFCLAFANQTLFFVGLGLIILGTGFFKSNVSTMVGQMYTEGDRRRDAGFTIFYMGINIGAFVCNFFGAALYNLLGWQWAFFAATSLERSMGLFVANTYTLNGNYGSHVTIPGTGILMNNEMDDFTVKVGVKNMFGLLQGPANAIAPGFIETDMTRATAERIGIAFDDMLRMAAAEIPVARVGQRTRGRPALR